MATTNNCDPQSSSDSTCDLLFRWEMFYLFIPETSQQFGYCLLVWLKTSQQHMTTVVQGDTKQRAWEDSHSSIL